MFLSDGVYNGLVGSNLVAIVSGILGQFLASEPIGCCLYPVQYAVGQAFRESLRQLGTDYTHGIRCAGDQVIDDKLRPATITP